MGQAQDSSWILLGTSAFLMFAGPSTCITSGFAFEETALPISYQIWVVNTMYTVWMLCGVLAGPLAAIFNAERIILLGCFSAACGFLIAASTIEERTWFFMSYALIVGLGLGLAVHTTLLLVISKFTKYKGLAVGIVQLNAALGYFFSLYLYSIFNGPEETFQLKSLSSVLAFFGAILYMTSESSWQTCGNLSDERGHFTQTPSDSNLNGSLRRESSQRDTTSLEEFPLTQLYNANDNFNGRKRSQYLLKVSASLLPNIPEESEGPSAAATGNCTPASSVSMNNLSNTKPVVETKNLEMTLNDTTVSTNMTSNIQGLPSFTSGQEEEQLSPESTLLDKLPERDSISNTLSNTEAFVNSQKQYGGRLNGVGTPIRDKLSVRQRIKREMSSLDRSYLTNPTFLIIAVGISLTMVTSPTVPVVVFAYTKAIRNLTDISGQGEMSLLLIYTADTVARLVVLYLSDLHCMKRKTLFYFSNLIGSLVIAGLGMVKDFRLIYILSVVYGTSTGVNVGLESLVLDEEFGTSALPTTYAFLHLIKVGLNLCLCVLLHSPTVGYTYAIHPMTPNLNYKYFAVNITSLVDPLGLFDDYGGDRLPVTFLLLAIPGIISALLWTMKELCSRNFAPTSRCQSASQAETSNQNENHASSGDVYF